MTRSSGIYSDAAQNFYLARIRPYVTDWLKQLRNLLHLTFFVSDPFIIAAWFGLFLFFWSGQRGTLLILIVPFAVINAVVVHDNRHAPPLIPIIILGR
jgi:hypothetical protein